MLKLLTPDFYVESVFDLDLEDLKRRGITTIMSDLDNTLVPWDQDSVNPTLLNWVNKVKKSGMKFILVSNAVEKRIDYFTQELGVPGIGKARKPLSRAFKEALDQLGVTVQETAMVGDQVFTDVLGGNRIGLYTILVVPLSQKELAITRVFRRLERLVLRYLVARGKLRGKPKV